MLNNIQQRIEQSPFKNIYWFARYLVNTDQYGALGKSKETQLLKIITIVETISAQNSLSEKEKFLSSKETLLKEIQMLGKNGSKSSILINNFIDLLNDELKSLDDVLVFCITMKYIVAPINHAISAIPADDTEFCYKAATSILDALGETKAGLVISTWDNLGVKGCLDAERASVVFEFTKLLEVLTSLNVVPHTSLDDNLLLTAFIQEFERRLGQKRKARGGGSLENIVAFLFSYFKFPVAEAPSHFDQDLEVDKWFKCKDGWVIGISCKRTLRERWKQVSQADRGTLSHFKIKELWHLITYDKDLSDDKIVRLGEQGQIFYLMDTSDVYLRASTHIGMKNYVRPLSNLVSDIRKNIYGEKGEKI